MSGNLLGIGVSGLKSSKSALSTTGHNIANAGVDGYTRQRTITETNPANKASGGYIGTGVNVDVIQRISDEFITKQVQTDTSLFTGIESYFNQITQLDKLLADPASGLAGAMGSFFNSVQNGADDPSSIPARQLIISEAQNLADRFNTVSARFDSINESTNAAMQSNVTSINALAENLAQLNIKISEALGVSNGAPPNDLYDQRDAALKELSKLTNIQVFDSGIGQINVSIGGGQEIVIGKEARTLHLVDNQDNPLKKDVIMQTESSQMIISDQLKGGELAGLYEFQNTILDTSYNELGRVAIAMSEIFNELHQQGVDLNNNFGREFFNDMNAPDIADKRVVGNVNNAKPDDRELAVYIKDVGALTASDYEFEINPGGNYVITRLTDGKEVANGLMPGAYPASIEFDGIEVELESGSFQPGDQFRIMPTRNAARDFQSVLVDPSELAFASPILTDASLGNSGTGVIDAGSVLSQVDKNGNTLPLFSTPGQLTPPMGIIFRSDNVYDVMDMTDPANPKHLEPPIRNQLYVVGAEDKIFSSDMGSTQVSTNGALIGIQGSQVTTSAAISMAPPTAVAPNYAVTDFSATGNQFSFDVAVSGTLSGVNDGVVTVNIANPAITDNNALVNVINAQLTGTDVRAFITDNGSLGFRLATGGLGDISLQNFNADPDGNGDNSPAGQANNLLGFDIEGSTFTTVGGLNGVTGSGIPSNGYPAETIQISYPNSVPGLPDVVQNVFTQLHASANETASLLNDQPGVSANAFNYIELSNYNLSRTEPLQFTLNGVDLVEYEVDNATGNMVLAPNVPDPAADPDAFNDYIAERINTDPTLAQLGVYASGAADGVSGQSQLHIHGSQGHDFEFAVQAGAGQSVNVGDGEADSKRLDGFGAGVNSSIIVGGRIDVELADGVSLGTFPSTSMLFGDTTAADFAQSNFMGIQATIAGVPDGRDMFTIGFNEDASMDNRNALAMAKSSTTRLMGDGSLTFSESYSSLVEVIGIDTNSSRINMEASEQVLAQTQSLRDSISAVNLDEEAANLIRYEQYYSANSQVIKVARDIFDELLRAFS